MTVSPARCMLAALALLAVAGCRQSRIADAEVVDVCALVSGAESERLFGAATAAVMPVVERGFAGGCAWTFAAGDTPARVSAQVMTKSSAADIMTTPQDWFDHPARLGELKANLGEPSDIKGLGFVARWYATRLLFVRKGATVIVLNSDRGEAAQMQGLAQTLLSPLTR